MKKSILILLLLAISILLHCETPLFRQLNRGLFDSIRNRDQNLPLVERLDRWFPHHQKIVMGDAFYLTTPYFRDFRSDFFVQYEPFYRRIAVIPDTTAFFSEKEIVLSTGEVIPAFNLTHEDFLDVKNQIAWLTVLFRTLGTPMPELMIERRDDIETYVIVNEDSLRQKVILPSFAETIKKLNQFYDGNVSYFQFNEVIKSNSRLEFFGHLFIRDVENETVDFIDVRFHTNRQNEINLVMFFIYRKV